MTGQRPDAERVIRDWLADSAPDRAPASLKEALEDATSRPAGHARPWSRAAGNGLLWAGRVAAAAAILAVAVSGAYLYANGRATAPGASPSKSPSASAVTIGSPTNVPQATPSPVSPKLFPKVTQLPGSNWRLVSNAFPRMFAPAWTQYESTVFELPGGSSAGFVAFVPSIGGLTQRAGGVVPMGYETAGPSPAHSWQTLVYQSGDGVTWTERSVLPSDAATVRDVAGYGGNIVAVGWTGVMPNERATTWTTTDLQTWRTAEPPIPALSDTYSDVFGVAAGPSGLLAWGNAGTTSMFWNSHDGAAWTSVAWSGLPVENPINEFLGVSDGWVIIGFLADREAVWYSSDGARWTQGWPGPAVGAPTSGIEYMGLGSIFKARGGGYISFGGVGVGGGPMGAPNDLLVWTSLDFTHWVISARVHRPGWMYAFASGPGGFVGAGLQVDAADASQPEYGTVGIWTSQDGRSWNAAEGLPSVASAEVVSVVSDGAHAVVTCVDSSGNVSLLVGDGQQ